MQRRHFLYLLIAMLALPPLAITGKLVGREANAQNLSGGASAAAAPSRVFETRHNLGSAARSRQTTSGNTVTTEAVVTAASTSEVCVFCHTPHGATNPGRPLWNRNDSGATYTPYSSSSLQATDIDVTAAALGAPSKMCLSCHDGTIALGNVANAPGSGSGSAIAVNNASPGGGSMGPVGSMPAGRGQANADHGFTRRLGTDLRNDHPISFTYDSALATADGELRTPPSTLSGRPLIANRVIGSPKPYFPLVGNKVQCTTCHDPHKQTQKFLNSNRLVRNVAPLPETAQTSYTDWTFNIDTDQICVACHTRLGKAWAVSAHSHSVVANETYNPGGDAAMRDFPTGTTVWQAGCLNCHDTHTVAGSRLLLREGSSSALGSVAAGTIGYSAAFRLGLTSAGDYKTTSALENSCYQCHGNTPVITPTLLSATEGVPNIQAEFARLIRMPITNADQGLPGGGNTTEVHETTDRDGTETVANLGAGSGGINGNNRHVECTDCHNPHRVVKADTFLGGNLVGGDVTRRTHVPARGTVGEHGNIASGALRGSWGVEPSYTAAGQTTVTGTSIWMSNETVTFTVKKGDPGAATTLPVGTAGTNAVTYLTREYQLCFKCHSSYANGPLATDFPNLKAAANGRGGTPTGTNGMTRYTDVAKEFAVRATDPPTSGTDQGEGTNVSTVCGGGDCVPAGTSWDINTPLASTLNHRSWHPVVFPTGRNGVERGSATFDNIRPPFNVAAKIGRQTMQCSDCHGQDTSWTDGTGPNLSQVQGPHGSANPFLLKGAWGTSTTLGNLAGNATELCANCHLGTGSTQSGWNGVHDAGGNMAGSRCTRCHIAVPHGWKNKAFLVNKRCVGTEGGQVSNCVALTNAYNNDLSVAPYYQGARLYFATWRRSRDGGYSSETTTCSGSGDMTNCTIP